MWTDIEYTAQQQGDLGRQTQEIVRQAMEQAKAQIEAARAQAELAREQAAQAREQTQEQRQELREQIRAIIDQARAEAEHARIEAGAEVPPPPPPFQFNDGGPPPGVIMLTIVLASAAVAALVLTPIARAMGRRMDKKTVASTPPEVGSRLERIEQAVEAIAIEVERVSENQRYSTKLISELRGLPAPTAMDQWPQSRGEAEPVARGASERSRT
jgi:hypothetical protein